MIINTNTCKFNFLLFLFFFILTFLYISPCKAENIDYGKYDLKSNSLYIPKMYIEDSFCGIFTSILELNFVNNTFIIKNLQLISPRFSPVPEVCSLINYEILK